MDRYWLYFMASVQPKEFDYKACADSLGAGSSDEGNGSLDGASCGQKIIYYDDAIFVIECVLVHFQCVCSIFEFVIDSEGVRGQFSRFPDGDEWTSQLCCHKGAEDEASSLWACDGCWFSHCK